MRTVSISDKAKAMFILESERQQLFQEAIVISNEMTSLLHQVSSYGNMMMQILHKQAALEEARDAL